MLTPFAFSGMKFSHSHSNVLFTKAYDSESRGEYNGYTYTEYDSYGGRTREYDSHELAPTIVQNFWAPSGFVYTLNYADEQVNELLDHAAALNNDYRYIHLACYYTRFGMQVYFETYIDDFYQEEDPREACKTWIQNSINNQDPFYEVKEATIETDISFLIDFEFVAGTKDYHFILRSETFYVEPFDETDFINFRVLYYERPDDGERRIDIDVDIVAGFFNDPEPYDNPYGYTTDEKMGRWVQNDFYSYDACKYQMYLYAYDSITIGEITDDGIEMSYPSHPLPVKIKIEFVVGGVEKSISSREFYIGDPNLCVTIDGYSDRTTVQRDSEHTYDVNINDLNVDVDNPLEYRAEAFLIPNRLEDANNVKNYYDLAIGPDRLDNYCLSDSANNWVYPNKNVFIEDLNDSNHYVLKNIYLAQDTEVQVSAENWENYRNSTTYEGCGYHLTGFWPNTAMDVSGYYDIDFYLNDPEENDNHLYFTLLSEADAPAASEETEKDYYIVGSFNNWGISDNYKLIPDEYDWNHYSFNMSLDAGDAFKVVDNEGNYISNTKTWECCGFTLDDNGSVIVEKADKYNIDFYVQSSRRANIVLHNDVLPLKPAAGEEECLYYIASNDEVRLHAEGKDDLFINDNAGGTYYIWDKENNEYTVFDGIELFEYDSTDEDSYDENGNLISSKVTVPYAGKYTVFLEFNGSTNFEDIMFQSQLQKLEVTASDASQDQVILTSGKGEAMPNDINIYLGGDSLEITPSISSEATGVKYYFYWSEPSKEGILDIEEGLNGKLIVTPLAVGIVETLSVRVESELFKPITRTISIRVLDAIFDVAKIQVPNEFHKAGKPLTASVSIRGFTGIQNVDIEWTAKTKDGKELEVDKQYIVNGNASMTIVKPESNDYTITASYQGVKLDTLTVQVRYTDLNKFLRVNIWWIFLMTIALVVVTVIFRKLFKRGRTTVENIERAYQVFCQCISDDKLTLPELKLIKRELTKCKRRCEDLNIEALNQYEKSIRYLRKSLIDTNNLIKKWDTISPEDKSVFTEQLNADFSKALMVAREIENAKDLIEQYHFNANKKNYETTIDEPIEVKK